ncbi:MAG: Hsp20/alpha crystallin family protein [Spirochaetes bacterium]|nr:Hsp20/alpha crystallin family protein [Spirochaetota bacterium]
MWNLTKCETPIEKLFDDFWSFPDFIRSEEKLFNVDFVENKDSYKLKADLPGVKKEDLDVSIENGFLTISAKRSSEKEHEEGEYHVHERSSGEFKRKFRVPEYVKAEEIKAEFKNGVLELIIPKAEKEENKTRIMIN